MVFFCKDQVQTWGNVHLPSRTFSDRKHYLESGGIKVSASPHQELGEGNLRECACPSCDKELARRGLPTNAQVKEREEERKEDAKAVGELIQASSTPIDQQVPAFAAVVQPGYEWSETMIMQSRGETILLRTTTGSNAVMKFPPGDSPLARAIKLHELLHARFTPDVHAALDTPDMKGVSEVARQIAEDVRLAALASERGLFKDEGSYFPTKIWARQSKVRKRTELDVAALYMSCYGQPLEGNWDTRSLSLFVDKSGAQVSKKTKRTLSRWKRRVNKALASKVDPQARFVKLAKITQDALSEVVTKRMPSSAQPGMGKPMQGPGSGDGSGSGSGKAAGAAGGQSKANDSKEENAREQLRKLTEQAKQKREGEQAKEINKALEAIRNPMLEKLTIQPEPKKAKAAAAREVKDDQRPAIQPKVFYRPWAEEGPRGPSVEDKSVADNYCLAVHPDAKWGIMSVHLAPLERNYRALVKRISAPSMEGAHPKLLHRWFGDQHLFERMGLRRGGTLLIDVSGSMNWAHQITKELIEAVPAMTIALYSSDADSDGAGGSSSSTIAASAVSGRSNYHSGVRLGRGRLTIIAKGGKLIPTKWDRAEHGRHGGDNLVDGPALAWLATQPRPRVWFSDGEVTGWVGGGREGTNYDLHLDVDRICKLGVIRRTVDPKEVIQIFTGRRPA